MLNYFCSFDFYNALESEGSPVGAHYVTIIKLKKSMTCFKSPVHEMKHNDGYVQKKSLYVLEPCLNMHFYRQHLLLPVEWIWSAEAGAGMPGVMWQGCYSKLNASYGSNQKGHSVGGRGREPRWKRSVKQQQLHSRTAHIQRIGH